MKHTKILILGSGPTGLGAAHRFKELGLTDFHVYEAKQYAGGLATSFLDTQGFWWDIGGHVQFSHYTYFDSLMDELLRDEWIYHKRESWVWMCNRFVPYPLQRNIHRLPRKVMKECLDGLLENSKKTQTNSPKSFLDWIYQTSGAGIAKHFLIPYNYKVWGYPPDMLNATWVGERVAPIDLLSIQKSVKSRRDDVSWGPNRQFRFPKFGGTGEIWTRLSNRIGSDYITYNSLAVSLNTRKKIITFANGERVSYDILISTIPIDLLIKMSDFSQKSKTITSLLKHSTTHIIGVGIKGTPNKELASKCWMYFPENDCPFYRVTLFSKYSPNNVPDSTHNFSLMTETTSSPQKNIDRKTLVYDVLKGLVNTKLLASLNKVIDIWVHEEPYGYPTPSIDRDEILEYIQPRLLEKNIFSRGRFGMWKYEVSNQDHSLMQGVEVANLIARGEKEVTAWYPDIVNKISSR